MKFIKILLEDILINFIVNRDNQRGKTHELLCIECRKRLWCRK